MDLAQFTATLDRSRPDPAWPVTLRALWHAADGDWDRAHKLVQSESDAAAAWVHAYLHRVEGDLSNAGYWYRRAGKPAATGALKAEWQDLVQTLLAEG